MYAADNVNPYCTRWLLQGRRAKVNVSSLAHHHHHNLHAIYFALKRFPATTTTTAAAANYHDKSLFNWWLMVHALLCFKADPFKWRESFPWACAVIMCNTRVCGNCAAVYMTQQLACQLLAAQAADQGRPCMATALLGALLGVGAPRENHSAVRWLAAPDFGSGALGSTPSPPRQPPSSRGHGDCARGGRSVLPGRLRLSSRSGGRRRGGYRDATPETSRCGRARQGIDLVPSGHELRCCVGGRLVGAERRFARVLSGRRGHGRL